MSRGRPVPVAWLDPVAGSPIEVAAGGLIVTGLGLLGMVWGAGVGSSWVVNGERADIGVSDAALALVRLGQNGLDWNGVWSPAIEESLAGPAWFWLFFAVEAVILALLFWPAWRLFGPRPADPMSVIIQDTPANHPRAARRKEAREARARARARRLVPAQELIAPPTMAPTIDKLLVEEANGHQVVLGRAGKKLVTTDNCASVIVFGPTQAGKTSALTVPAALDWQGPALIVTAKSDIVSLTWREQAKAGGRMWLFDPMSSMAGAETTDDDMGSSRRASSDGWSPLHLIEAVPRTRNEPELGRRVQQWGRARRTAQWMVSAARTSQAQGEMPEPWFVAAEQMLAPMLLAAATEEVSIGQVAAWVDRRDSAAVTSALELAGVAEALGAWEGARNHDPTTTAGTYQILALIMVPYGDPRVLNQARTPEINARELLDGGPNTLYLLSPPNHQQRLRPLMTTLVSEVLDSAMGQAAGSPAGRLRAPLLVIFDDAVGCAPLHLLDQLASVGAGLGIQVMTLFQDLAHVERVFGPERAVQLAGNHRAKVVLPGISDTATLGYVNSLIKGNPLVGGNAIDRDEGEGRRDPLVLANPSWMRTLNDGDALCVYGNLPPVRMSLRPWFGDAGLRRRIEPPAETRRRFGWRRTNREDLVGTGFPNPLDSDSNDREAARYWESVVGDGTLPSPRAFDDGTGHDLV